MSGVNMNGIGSIANLQANGNIDVEMFMMQISAQRASNLESQMKDQVNEVKARQEVIAGLTKLTNMLSALVKGAASGETCMLPDDPAAFKPGATSWEDVFNSVGLKVQTTDPNGPNYLGFLTATVTGPAEDTVSGMQDAELIDNTNNSTTAEAPAQAKSFSALFERPTNGGCWNTNNHTSSTPPTQAPAAADAAAAPESSGGCPPPADAAQDSVNQSAADQLKQYAAKETIEGWIDGLKGNIDGLNSQGQLDMIRLQSIMNKRNESFEQMTNMMQKFNKARESIVRNI